MRKLLLPFVTAGYPTKAGCVELLEACARGGGDQIELGIPFSDPLADGPVIQATSYKALVGGITIDDVQVHQPSLDDVFFALTGHAAEDEAVAA